jgi:hypothetical protein
MKQIHEGIVTFRGDSPIWERTFTVNPLLLVGTREKGGDYDLAPKHMAAPMGWRDYFGFVCTPRHLPQRETGGGLHRQLPPSHPGGHGEPGRDAPRGGACGSLASTRCEPPRRA